MAEMRWPRRENRVKRILLGQEIGLLDGCDPLAALWPLPWCVD